MHFIIFHRMATVDEKFQHFHFHFDNHFMFVIYQTPCSYALHVHLKWHDRCLHPIQMLKIHTICLRYFFLLICFHRNCVSNVEFIYNLARTIHECSIYFFSMVKIIFIAAGILIKNKSNNFECDQKWSTCLFRFYNPPLRWNIHTLFKKLREKKLKIGFFRLFWQPCDTHQTNTNCTNFIQLNRLTLGTRTHCKVQAFV